MNILEGLDPEQLAAATAPDGPVRISAGAGTGKTTTLTARIGHLISGKGLAPESITAVTFTRKAANELRERVAARLGEGAAALRLGTFHSLSCRILRRNASAAGLRDGNFTIVDEDDARKLMAAACEVPGAYGPFVPPHGDEATVAAVRKEWEAGLRDFAKAALRQVSLWKAWGLTETEAGDPSRPRRSEEEEAFAAAYVAYQYELESRNMVDFGDLILKVVRLLRDNPRLCEIESSRIRHLLVDEAQDANPVQVEWVRLLSSWHGSLTVVGDEDQSIYGFQGGYPGAMADMVGPSAAVFELRTNRRCTEEILRPANLAVDYNRRKEPKVLKSNRSGPEVRTTAHATEAQEAAWVAARIRELVNGGADPGQIAVLFRASWMMPPFEEALMNKGVMPVVTSGISLLEREEVKDVLGFLRLAVNPYDDLAFRRVANRPVRGLGPAAVDAICAIASARAIPFHEACHAAVDPRSGAKFRKDAKEGAAALGRALSMLAEDGKWERPAYDVVGTALRETGYLEHLTNLKEGSETKLRSVETVRRLSDPYEDAASFLQEISVMTDEEADVSGSVRLSTMHASKGLEFDHVFCPGFDDGVMPSARALEEGRRGKPGDPWNGPRGGGVEEERRLAHVAFTRARKTLDVSFPWKRLKSFGKGGGPSSLVEECELEAVEPDGMPTPVLKGRKGSARKNRMGYDR